MRFLPSKTSTHFRDKLKFGENAIEGVFLGYRMHAGLKWSGRYLVAPLEDFDAVNFLGNNSTYRPPIHPQDVSKVHSVSLGAAWDFPLMGTVDQD